jgi:hypothetical protein
MGRCSPIGEKSLVTVAGAATAAATAVTAAAFAAIAGTAAAVAATAAAAAGTIFTGTSFVDGEIAAIESFAVQGFDRFAGVVGAFHGDEAEAARAAGHAVHDEVDGSDLAVGGEKVLEVVFGGAEGKVPHE